MAAREEKGGDFYSVLGLGKECSHAELKTAYRKLAMKWHPDRCSGSESSKMEEATTKFQEIQEAYSALSEPNKRLLYDLGIEDENDDDENYGMSDFLDEMVTLMSKTEPSNKSAQESFEELQYMFLEMLQTEVKASFNHNTTNAFSSSFSYCAAKSTTSWFDGMMDSTNMPFGEKGFGAPNLPFCFGSSDLGSLQVKGGAGRRRRNSRSLTTGNLEKDEDEEATKRAGRMGARGTEKPHWL